MDINYEKLLDDWGEKVLAESDKSMKLYEEDNYEESKVGEYKQGYRRGYSDGLRMALAILNRMEKVWKLKCQRK